MHKYNALRYALILTTDGANYRRCLLYFPLALCARVSPTNRYANVRGKVGSTLSHRVSTFFHIWFSQTKYFNSVPLLKCQQEYTLSTARKFFLRARKRNYFTCLCCPIKK
jgi:hypothetical protein